MGLAGVSERDAQGEDCGKTPGPRCAAYIHGWLPPKRVPAPSRLPPALMLPGLLCQARFLALGQLWQVFLRGGGDG